MLPALYVDVCDHVEGEGRMPFLSISLYLRNKVGMLALIAWATYINIH